MSIHQWSGPSHSVGPARISRPNTKPNSVPARPGPPPKLPSGRPGARTRGSSSGPAWHSSNSSLPRRLPRVRPPLASFASAQTPPPPSLSLRQPRTPFHTFSLFFLLSTECSSHESNHGSLPRSVSKSARRLVIGNDITLVDSWVFLGPGNMECRVRIFLTIVSLEFICRSD